MKARLTRLNATLKKSMPKLLDTTGIILLSSSAMSWDTSAGLAAAGVGCFVLNYRWHDRS